MGRRIDRIHLEIADEANGQALAEYAIILLLVAVACVAATTLLGSSIVGLYNSFNGSF